MRKPLRQLALIFTVALTLPGAALFAQDPPNPAMEKFQQDMKTAVMNGSITIPQVKQLQTDAETLKNARAEQVQGSPVDLLTPYRAVVSMKKTMATVDAKDRETLRQDLQAVIADKQQTASAAPPRLDRRLEKTSSMP